MCIKSEFAYFLLLVPNDCEKKAFRANLCALISVGLRY